MKGVFHSGELEMQRRAGVQKEAEAVGRTIAAHMPAGARRFLARQRLAVAATVEPGGGVWASLLTGPEGFAAAVDAQLLRVAAQPTTDDPMATNLAARPELGLLFLEPRTRQRVRFNGRGLLAPDGVFLLADEVYGNCPKYIQLRRPRPDAPIGNTPPRVSAGLDPGQQAAVAQADTFFIASVHPGGGADASHRGGHPGFVRVLGSGRIAFPNYPGNSMFNTLGNLANHAQAGLLFVDFTTGDVLQLSGRAHVQSDFSVVFDIDIVRETTGGSPLRFDLVEYSPANPAERKRDDQAHRLR